MRLLWLLRRAGWCACLCLILPRAGAAAIEVLYAQTYVQEAMTGTFQSVEGLGRTNLSMHWSECFPTGSNTVCAEWLTRQTSCFHLTATGFVSAVATDVRATNSGLAHADIYPEPGTLCVFRVAQSVDYSITGHFTPGGGTVVLDDWLSDRTIHRFTHKSTTDFHVTGRLAPGEYRFWSSVSLHPTNAYVEAATSLSAALNVTLAPTNAAPPVLDVTRDGTNLVLQWPTNGSCQLQATAQLHSSGEAVWTNVPGAPPLHWPMVEPSCFFRLNCP